MPHTDRRRAELSPPSITPRRSTALRNRSAPRLSIKIWTKARLRCRPAAVYLKCAREMSAASTTSMVTGHRSHPIVASIKRMPSDPGISRAGQEICDTAERPCIELTSGGAWARPPEWSLRSPFARCLRVVECRARLNRTRENQKPRLADTFPGAASATEPSERLWTIAFTRGSRSYHRRGPGGTACGVQVLRERDARGSGLRCSS